MVFVIFVVSVNPALGSLFVFLIFFCSGEGKGESGATGRRGVVFFFENPRRGGFPRVSEGNFLGGGGGKIFFFFGAEMPAKKGT